MLESRNFIAYEYQEIAVPKTMEPVYMDAYQNFGWIPEAAAAPAAGIHSVSLKFKRDRKIRNKAELSRLQRQFEACAHEIMELEKSKAARASIAAFSIGLLGTALIGGSTFAYLGGMIALMIVLAVPGFLGWILPYFCYQFLYGKRTAQVTPLIEKKYDEAYEVCEKAHGLLGKL